MPIRMIPEEARDAILKGSCPDGATVTGILDIHRDQTLTRLPKDLTVEGMLRIQDCHRLTHLPKGLSARSLLINNCASLHGTASDFGSDALAVPEDIEFLICPQLVHLPDELNAGGHVTLVELPQAGQPPIGPARAPEDYRWRWRSHLQVPLPCPRSGKHQGRRQPADHALRPAALAVVMRGGRKLGGCVLRKPDPHGVNFLWPIRRLDCQILRFLGVHWRRGAPEPCPEGQ